MSRIKSAGTVRQVRPSETVTPEKIEQVAGPGGVGGGKKGEPEKSEKQSAWEQRAYHGKPNGALLAHANSKPIDQQSLDQIKANQNSIAKPKSKDWGMER